MRHTSSMARLELASTRRHQLFDVLAGDTTSMAGSDLDDELDDEFPLGDGTAESSAEVVCPYCGESVVVGVDSGGGSVQQYVEDCEVCCNPWSVTVRFVSGVPEVSVDRLDS